MAVTRESVKAFFDFLSQNGIVPSVEKYYHDDIVLGEAGLEPKVGKAAVLAAETYFANLLQVTGKIDKIENHHIVVQDNIAVIEQTLTITFKGAPAPLVQTQVSIQHWKDGKIIKETFYHTKKAEAH